MSEEEKTFIKYTVRWPLIITSKEDTFETFGSDEIAEVINFNIKSVILTHPGERRSDVNFGVGARKYLFQYNSSQISDFEEAGEEIIKQLTEYVPYIIIDDLSILVSEESANAIKIALQYTIPERNMSAIFELLVSE